MIAGTYKTHTGSNAKGHFLGVQVFADGTVFNTRGIFSVSLIHDSGNFLGAKTGPMKGVTFGAAISFPNGVKLSNLPLIGKIPNIKYVPPLGKGLIFTYSNKRNGVNKLMDNLPVSCAKKGGILDKNLARSAADFEKKIREVKVFRGITIPEFTIPLDKLEGPLKPLSKLVTKGTYVKFSGLIDPKRGNYKFDFGIKGNIDLKSSVAKFKDGKFDAAFKYWLNENDHQCRCPEDEVCPSYIKKKNPSLVKKCWDLNINVAGQGSLHLELGEDEALKQKKVAVFSMKAKGEIFRKAGQTQIKLEAGATALVFGATTQLYFNLEPNGNNYNVLVALRIKDLHLIQIPFLRKILKATKTQGLSLDHAVFYFANYEKNIEGTQFKPGVTLAGMVSMKKGPPAFVKELSFLHPKFQSAQMSAWFPIGGTDYAVSAGITGSLSINMASASLTIKDPSMQLYGVNKKHYVDLKISGSAKIGDFAVGIDGAHIKIVGTDGFFLTVKVGGTNVQRARTYSLRARPRSLPRLRCLWVPYTQTSW
jgi:hypothetical protein